MSIQSELQLPQDQKRNTIKGNSNPIEQPKLIPRHVHNDADSPRIDLRDVIKTLQPASTVFLGTISEAAGALPDPVDPITGFVNPAWAFAVTDWLAEINFRDQVYTNILADNKFGRLTELGGTGASYIADWAKE